MLDKLDIHAVLGQSVALEQRAGCLHVGYILRTGNSTDGGPIRRNKGGDRSVRERGDALRGVLCQYMNVGRIGLRLRGPVDDEDDADGPFIMLRA